MRSAISSASASSRGSSSRPSSERKGIVLLGGGIFTPTETCDVVFDAVVNVPTTQNDIARQRKKRSVLILFKQIRDPARSTKPGPSRSSGLS
jgi:hypothetical protein